MSRAARTGLAQRVRTVERTTRSLARRGRSVTVLLGDAVTLFVRGGGSSNGAAVAFYAVLSAAPLMLVMVSIAGLLYGTETVQRQLDAHLAARVGGDVASVLRRLMDAMAASSEAGGLAAVLGMAALLWGAARLFVQLQKGLNATWGVRQRTDLPFGPSLVRVIRKRIASFAMVVLCGLLLASLLIVQTVLSAVARLFEDVIRFEPLWHGVNLLLSFGVLAVLFAALYRNLPDARIGRRDLWIGAIFTSATVGLGMLLIGLYLGYIGIASTYGAAGSLVLLLLWVYYSAQAFYFGAAFTRAWSARYGTDIRAQPHATRM